MRRSWPCYLPPRGRPGLRPRPATASRPYAVGQPPAAAKRRQRPGTHSATVPRRAASIHRLRVKNEVDVTSGWHVRRGLNRHRWRRSSPNQPNDNRTSSMPPPTMTELPPWRSAGFLKCCAESITSSSAAYRRILRKSRTTRGETLDRRLRHGQPRACVAASVRVVGSQPRPLRSTPGQFSGACAVEATTAIIGAHGRTQCHEYTIDGLAPRSSAAPRVEAADLVAARSYRHQLATVG